MTGRGPFGDVPGAVVDDGVLMHVGRPLAEQRDLVAGRAVAPLHGRAVLAVTGADRLGWLDSLSTQRLTALEPGRSTETLILDPQGHIEHAAAVVDDGATTWLITDRADAGALLAWLVSMRFRLDVQPRAADGELAVVGGTVAAVTAARPAVRAGVPLVWRDPWPGVADGGVGYSVGEHPATGRDWAEALVPPSALSGLAWQAQSGAVRVAGAMAVEALRVAAWRPTWADVDERTLPHEMDWLRTAVHTHKGCYRGQETVAKVHNLGHPPRRLVALQLDGSESILPARGGVVRLGDRDIGHVRAAAVHYEDGPIALALVRRTAPVDADLVVHTSDGPVAAAQEVIVPPGAGAAARAPKLPPLRRR